MITMKMLLLWAVLPLGPQDGTKARVDEATPTSVTVTTFRSGDSADNPTGQQMELALDFQTKYFNSRGIEVKDAASKAGILKKGAILIAKTAQKDGKTTAVSLTAVGS
jgi:hypothetical protein